MTEAQARNIAEMIRGTNPRLQYMMALELAFSECGILLTKQQALYLVGLASDRPSSLAAFI